MSIKYNNKNKKTKGAAGGGGVEFAVVKYTDVGRKKR